MTPPTVAALAAQYLIENPGTLADVNNSPADWIRDFATWLEPRLSVGPPGAGVPEGPASDDAIAHAFMPRLRGYLLPEVTERDVVEGACLALQALHHGAPEQPVWCQGLLARATAEGDEPSTGWFHAEALQRRIEAESTKVPRRARPTPDPEPQ